MLLGGVDRTGTYLMTPTTYDLVCEYKRRAVQVVPWSQRALVLMLEQDGLLVSTDSDGRHKAVVRAINGHHVRCWHVARPRTRGVGTPPLWSTISVPEPSYRYR